MAGTLVPDVVGTEYSVQGVSKYVAFEAQSLTVMQILDEHMALGLEIPEQGAPLNNEPHSTQVLYEHKLIQGMAVPVRNTTSLIRSPRAGAEYGFSALRTPNGEVLVLCISPI